MPPKGLNRIKGLSALLLADLPNHIALIFSSFRARPEILPKSTKICNAFSTDGMTAQIRLMSFANWLVLISLSHTIAPFTISLWMILLDICSAVNTNKNGESVHPCLSPLKGFIHFEA